MRKMSRNCYWAVRDKRNPRCFNCTHVCTDGINTYTTTGRCLHVSTCKMFADIHNPVRLALAVRQRALIEMAKLMNTAEWMKDNGRLNIHHDEARTLDWARSKILARMAGSKCK